MVKQLKTCCINGAIRNMVNMLQVQIICHAQISMYFLADYNQDLVIQPKSKKGYHHPLNSNYIKRKEKKRKLSRWYPRCYYGA